ncbi:MAG: Crp/Fnr family transcriptional regulator [Thiotrichales bacterium]
MSLEKIKLLELTPEDVDMLASYGRTQRYPKQSLLMHKGEESTGVYVINSGRVKVYISDEDGDEKIFRYQGPGEFFGEMGVLNNSPRTAFVATVGECRLTYISRANFERCLEENSDIALKLIRFFIQRIEDLSDDLADCALKDIYHRLRDKLPELAEEVDGVQMLKYAYTQKELAGLVAGGRESVNRMLKKLEKLGYMEKRGRRWVILKKLPRNLPAGV